MKVKTKLFAFVTALMLSTTASAQTTVIPKLTHFIAAKGTLSGLDIRTQLSPSINTVIRVNNTQLLTREVENIRSGGYNYYIVRERSKPIYFITPQIEISVYDDLKLKAGIGRSISSDIHTTIKTFGISYPIMLTKKNQNRTRNRIS